MPIFDENPRYSSLGFAFYLPPNRINRLLKAHIGPKCRPVQFKRDEFELMGKVAFGRAAFHPPFKANSVLHDEARFVIDRIKEWVTQEGRRHSEACLLPCPP